MTNNATVTYDSPTWNEVFNRWVTKDVPNVKVVKFNNALHNSEVPWFEHSPSPGSRLRPDITLAAGPVATTAQHLINGKVTRTPEVYAAFAIHATMKMVNRCPYMIGNVVADRLAELDLWPSHYWRGNAVNVLPLDPPYRMVERNPDWTKFIDAAAIVWAEIATHFHVVRIPSLLDARSGEYRVAMDAVNEQHQAQELLEYQRLKKKFDDSPTLAPEV